MMIVVRRSRTALVGSLMSLVMLGLVLCPCPAMLMSAGAAEPSHHCCAAKEGLSALTVSCCASHDTGPPRVLSAAPPMLGVTPPMVVPVRVVLALPHAPVTAGAVGPLHPAALPILRI